MAGREASAAPLGGFSLVERDRRWSLVRSLMEAASIDVLVVPTENDARYLTQASYDVGPVILTLSGEVTLISNHGRVGQPARAWVGDIRSHNRRWADGIIERLLEINIERKIVGITGLDGFMRRPDGDFNYGTFVALRDALPRARWVGATQLMQEARYRKSGEEIERLAYATAATDAGLLAVAASFAVGVSDRELWGQMVLAMMRAGGDHPQFGHLGLTPMADIRDFPVQPQGDLIGPGNIVFTEVGGRFQGYEAQGVQPVASNPVPADWLDAWRVHQEAWDRTWELLRPGVRFAELVDVVRGVGAGRFSARQTLHGRGLGDDMPLITSSASSHNRLEDRVLETGVCFVLKPYAVWNDDTGPKELNWGDTVVVTERGPRRLGSRPHELMVRG